MNPIITLPCHANRVITRYVNGRPRPSMVSSVDGVGADLLNMPQRLLKSTWILAKSSLAWFNLCRKYVGTDRDVVGGDDNNSKGILLPIEELATACLNNDRE